MPSFNTEGKSREDLALVIQLAGLLTHEEASAKTLEELVSLIEAENKKSEAAELDIIRATAGIKKDLHVRKRKAAKADIVAPQTAAPAESAKKAPRRRTAQTVAPAKPAGRRKKPPAALIAEPPAIVQITTSEGEEPVSARSRRPRKTAREKSPEKLPLENAAEESRPSPDLTAAPSEPDTPPVSDLSAGAPEELKPVRRRKTRTRTIKADADHQTEEISPAAPVNFKIANADESADEPRLNADSSPEAAEAAADSRQPEARRLPPNHTLAPTRPNPRRTRIIGTPDRHQPGQAADKPARHQPRQAARPLSPQPPLVEPDKDEKEEDLTDFAAAAAAETSEKSVAQAQRPSVEAGDLQAGILEIMPDGYGFLRKDNYIQGNRDIYVPPQYIRRFGLRPGDHVSGPVKLQRENDRYQALLYIKEVNGLSPEKMIRRPHFDRLTPIYPDQRFILETVRNELSTRIIDLVAPIGKGQRGMIVSPPKAGKTILLQKIANAISINNPEIKLIVLLIDERPEEVTDMQRSIKGEVVYSTFDKTPENHTKITELVLERAMRLVELKHDVVILLDSMTRLARAYNLSINPTGRTLSGGLDPGALYGPKRFFGAARNIENGGSLTIIATSLIETGSRMDEVIFEEFKGTGNMEVYLDRKMSEKRIFPAIDINKSGTRREELLMTGKELDAVWTIRKAFGQLDSAAVTEAIINLLLKTTSNQHFISSVNVSFNDKNVFEAMRGVRPSDVQSGRGGGQVSYNNSGYGNGARRQVTQEDDP